MSRVETFSVLPRLPQVDAAGRTPIFRQDVPLAEETRGLPIPLRSAQKDLPFPLFS
jgi:hypothetical protein